MLSTHAMGDGAEERVPEPRRRSPRRWADLPWLARVYTLFMMCVAAALLLAAAPVVSRTPPLTLVLLLVAELAASRFKMRLPLPAGGATMSLTYAVDFVSLLLVGPEATMAVAAVGVWEQCTFNTATGRRTALHQTAFSIAAIVVSVAAMGLVIRMAGGTPGELTPVVLGLAFPLSVILYFGVNTGLVAIAIGLATNRPVVSTWHDNFLWAAPSYFSSAAAAIVATVAFAHGEIRLVPVAIASLWLTYVAYRIYLNRYAAAEQQAREIAELHESAVAALERARESEAELELRSNELAATLRAISNGVVRTDAVGIILHANAVAEQMTGCPVASMAGRPIADVFPFIDSSEDPQSAQQGTRVTTNHPDGLARVIERSVSAVSPESGLDGFVWVFRDVTNAVRLEEERVKASQLESIGVLAGGLAHDFNNLLMIIVGNLSFAGLDTTLAPETVTALDAAEQACDRAVGLTKQLLALSKGGATVTTRGASIAELVRNCVTFALHGSNVISDLVIPNDLWCADVDTGQISQVIHNLVINAMHAMPNGGSLHVHCANVSNEIRAARALPLPPGAYLELSFTDQGKGIAPEHLSKVFDPYFTTKVTGHGLGLATSYSIIKSHGGMISVSSRLGEGTCFVIHLPASMAEPVVESPDSAFDRHVSQATASRRILIMDDEEGVRAMAVRWLTHLGYTTDAVPEGRAALARHREARESGRPFDVVMLDLTVPGGMGGRETLEELRRIDPDVGVVIATGYVDASTMSEFRGRHRTAVLSKPYAISVLQATLERMIAEVQHA